MNDGQLSNPRGGPMTGLAQPFSTEASRPRRRLALPPLRIFALPVLWTGFFLAQHKFYSWNAALNVEGQSEIIYWQFAALAFVCVFALPTYIKKFIKLGRVSIALGVFLTYLMFNCAVSIEPAQSVLFVLGFTLFIASMPALWMMDESSRRQAYLVGAICILLASAYLFTILPFYGRTVGGVKANHFSHGAMLAIALTFMSRTRFKWFLFIPAVVLLAVSNGRTAMVCLVVFFLIYQILTIRKAKFERIALYSTLLALLGAIFFGIFSSQVYTFLVEFLALNDDVRGLGTGFTGRTNYWSQSGVVTAGHEAFGLGVQTRSTIHETISLTNNLHSGLLNAFAELGVVGLAIYLVVYISASATWILRARSGGFESVCVAAYMISMLPRLIMEPSYLSFWDPPQIAFWFFVVGAAVRINSGAHLRVGSGLPIRSRRAPTRRRALANL